MPRIGAMASIDPAARRRPVETKVVRFRAGTPDEVQRRYLADVHIRLRTGWALQGVDWDRSADRPTLVARYARDVEGDMAADVGGWLARQLARPHLAAILTTVAVTVMIWSGLATLLNDSGWSGEAGAVALLLAYLAGLVVGLRTENLGRGRDALFDWPAVLLGSFLLLVVVSAVSLFLALWGTLAGLYGAAVLGGAWLVLRAGGAVWRRTG